MNDTMVTIRGWVGSAPRFYEEKTQEDGTTFRAATLFNVGVTPRYYSRAREEYYDGVTTWYSVRCRGTLAENAARSLSRGTPVLVRGKLTSRTYADKDGVARTAFDLHADSIGVEISTGMANFARVMNSSLVLVDADEEKLNTEAGQVNEAMAESVVADLVVGAHAEDVDMEEASLATC